MNCNNCKLHGISCTGGKMCKEVCEKTSMYEPMTNADRIRSMTDEELAELLHNHACSYGCPIDDCPGRAEVGRNVCKWKWLDWLKEEGCDGVPV